MRIEEARFERATVRPEDEPRPIAGDVVFLGRSNVGKSSLINALLGTAGLARTSSTPGRTQTVNFYRVNGRHYFVDLPGYGYAKAPLSVRKEWGPMVEGFLERRGAAIAVAVVLVDSRHPVGELDRTMLHWLVERDIPAVAVGVKADKLSGNGRAKAAQALAEALPVEAGALAPFLVSAETGLGLSTLWKHLDAALAERRFRMGHEQGTGREKGHAWTSES